MSTTVTYKGDTIATVNNNTKTLQTSGKWLEGDITLVDNSNPTRTATITTAGISTTVYVLYNNTKYYSLGTFSFHPGDTLTCVCGGAYSVGFYIDNVAVGWVNGNSTSTSTTYNYTLPDCDISLEMRRTNTSSRSINITTHPPLITKEITANGTYYAEDDDAEGYSSVVVQVQDGASGAFNIAQGSFTTGSTRNSTATVTIPYVGNGYLISLQVYINDGLLNTSNAWYASKTNRYDVGFFSMVKGNTTNAPTFTGSSSSINNASVLIMYKNSTTSATVYASNFSLDNEQYKTSNASAGVSCCMVKGNGNTTMSYYIGNGASGSIGLAPSTTYDYIAVYSS